MKLVYLIHSLYNPGGMERVLLNKVRWLAGTGRYEILVVTTDQHGRPPFYPFPAAVRMVDLDVNYTDDNGLPAWQKITSYFRKRRMHRKRLEALLQAECADIVLSLFPSESSFLPEIQDGSKKILELHYGRFFRLQYGRSGLLGLADRFRTRTDRRLASRFDRFVVLTEEDRGDWGALPNLLAIPNAAMPLSEAPSDVCSHRVIAVGRLDYQKSFDRLLEVWARFMLMLRQHPDMPQDWHLDIFGQGPWRKELIQMTETLQIADVVRIHAPVEDIGAEYAKSAMLVMTSHYEGLPMVMLEAMASGLPAVSFDFKCGPRDLIEQGVNGLLVPDGDLDGLAEAILRMASDLPFRQSCGKAALLTAARYNEQYIMQQWEDCFRSILS